MSESERESELQIHIEQLREQNRLLRDMLARRRSIYDRFFDAVARVLNQAFPGFKTRGLVAIAAAAAAWASEHPDQVAALAAEYPVAAKLIAGAWAFLTWSSYEAGRRRPPKLPPPVPGGDEAPRAGRHVPEAHRPPAAPPNPPESR